MHAAKAGDSKARPRERAKDYKIGSTDRMIDNLIHELYGLTEDEIRIMEGK